ncbi:TPA: restriction endonuclease subunit S [Escherichia coli]|uniref:restriction endonuclease subunit S n=1 Tax=Escherichia coli TaxID=562 RepID=UPI0007A586BF|nr:restriction endonuclease subunit S [Escherichia coli]EFM2070933.1 restriction endonuclease subunit S [Escherichia coli]QMQ44679.1 restriction endonuclease subunit S [Escherichia coli]HBC1751560.1 restriction endonuclease subunit S [Escherichia coli]HDX3091440.1 restriction endonuclease subunit S [Escherichia coli]HEA3494596.1 restriction endonuclease subunit S [Escherichia coli]
MSELSYLEKLLDGVEVEWRNLGDTSLFEIANNGRKPVKASLRIAGETPYYGANNIQDYVDGYTHDGEYVLIAEDGSASLENYSIQYATGKFWANNHVHVVRGKERVHSRFLYHYLCIVNFLPFLTGGGRAKLTKGQLIEIPVPIPCPDNPEKSLAIQSEIVRILDKFTALTAELTAELNMRKKQYNHYRDQLLSFEDGEVEWKALEEVSDIYDSLHQTPQYSKNGLSMIRVTDIKNGYIDLKNTLKVNDGIFSIFTKKYLPQKNDLVMSRVGSYGNVGIIPTDNSACMGQNTVVIHPHINNRYLFYILTSSIGQDFIEKNVGGGSQKTLSLKSIKSIPIPLTGESEQSKIVSILDKFDTLTTSISEGLPREIELRQKQYEYYRDLLFSFPRPETASN